MSREELSIVKIAVLAGVGALVFLWILTRVKPSTSFCTCAIGGGGTEPVAFCVVHMMPPPRPPSRPARGWPCPFCEGTGRYEGTDSQPGLH